MMWLELRTYSAYKIMRDKTNSSLPNMDCKPCKKGMQCILLMINKRQIIIFATNYMIGCYIPKKEKR